MQKNRASSNENSPTYNPQSLLTYRVLVLSNTLGKGAVRFYARRFQIPLAEWRLIATLALHAPISVNALSVELSTDKGWISRTAAALVKKGLVKTRTDDADARKLLLDLSPKGRALYARIAPAVRARQARLLSALSQRERTRFEATLAKLQRRASEMLTERHSQAAEHREKRQRRRKRK